MLISLTLKQYKHISYCEGSHFIGDEPHNKMLEGYNVSLIEVVSL